MNRAFAAVGSLLVGILACTTEGELPNSRPVRHDPVVMATVTALHTAEAWERTREALPTPTPAPTGAVEARVDGNRPAPAGPTAPAPPPPTATATPTATPKPTATPEPPPPMIPRLPKSVNQFVTPTPPPRRLAVVPPTGLDLHGLDLMRIGNEITKTYSPSTSLTYETVKGEAVTLIIASDHKGVVHSAKVLWASKEIPWDELYILGTHVDPDDWTGCVLDAAFVAHRSGQPRRALPLTARGNWLFATADTEEDGSYSLTYTSWEFMPAFEPDKLPIECE